MLLSTHQCCSAQHTPVLLSFLNYSARSMEAAAAKAALRDSAEVPDVSPPVLPKTFLGKLSRALTYGTSVNVHEVMMMGPQWDWQ
jgi:hypothetical protein